MKHKLTYSLLLSLVVLLSFDLALAQNVTVTGPTTDLHPNTAYYYDVVLDNGTGITAFILPISVSGAGYLSGSVAVTLCGVTTCIKVVDQVKLGYTGPDLGPGPLILATLKVTTTGDCGETFTIEAGSMPPCQVPRFAGGLGCAVATTFTGLTATLYDGTPVCGTNLDDHLVCGGSIVNKQINATEPIGLPLTYAVITGPGTVDPISGKYNYTPLSSSCDFSALVEIQVTNPCGNSVVCPFTIYYDQEAPVLAQPSGGPYHWALGPMTINLIATDDNCPNTHILTYTIQSQSVPELDDIEINALTGVITIDPACADIAGSPHIVTVRVSDGCEYNEKLLSITVTDTPPWIICPANVPLWYSYEGPMDLPFTSGDADSDPITVTILSTTKNALSATPSTPMTITGPPYNFNWDPTWADEGLWEVTLQTDDGCMQSTCLFTINVVGKFFLCMDSVEVLPGYEATVTLSVYNSLAMGGFDLLITYGLGGLYFKGAVPVGQVADWEYFTYRFSEMDNCGGGCPTGVIRLVGIVNMPDGHTPAEDDYHPEGAIVELTFGTPQDLSFVNQCFILSWTWFDCGDNGISSRTGDTLFVAQEIEDILPEAGCLDGWKPGVTVEPKINFCDGRICLRPPTDDRGDINLNGIANEIADAVLYSNYFIYGPLVLEPYFETRKLASDINDDGIPLTVADLVYLVRIITGDANPYPNSGEKIAPFASSADLTYILGDKMVVTAQSAVDLGAAAFVFRHTGVEVGAAVASEAIGDMTLRSADRNGELRVLVFSMKHNTIDAGVRELFTVPMSGGGTMELVEVQFSDAQGNMMAVNTAKVAPPTAFELMQNYPNPFNAATVIRFALPKAADWSLRIYNVAGQLVDEFSGRSDAGVVSVNWNRDNASSGVYFYKLNAGSFADTKKMILMK